MKIIRKTPAFFLALIITVLSGCGGNTSWVYEMNDDQLPAGLYINFMMTALSELESKETETADHSDPNHVHPTAKELLKGSADGVSNSDFVKREAALLAAEYFVVSDKFRELGLTLSETDLSTVTQYTDYVWTSGSADLEKNGIGKRSVELYQTFDLKKGYVFDALYGQEGERAVPEQELKDLFDKDYARIEIMYVDVPKTDGVEDAAEKAKIEDYFARYKQGEEIEQLDYEYRGSLLEDEEEKKALVKSEAGAATTIIATADDTDNEVIIAAIRGAAIGEPMLTQVEDVYYLYKRLDIFEKPEDFEGYRSTLVYDLKYEEYEQYLRGLAEGLSMNANEASLRRYTPDKLKLD